MNPPVAPVQGLRPGDCSSPMVGVTKIQRQNANYWIEAVAEGTEDYYSKPGESPGQWLGSAASELGLSGEIGREEYAAALAGRDPTSGESLVNRPPPRSWVNAAGRERHAEPVLGFDVRFAAPKSVSLLYGLGSPEVRDAVLRAHDGAVAEAIAYLEQHACFVSRGKGGARAERGGGFLAMGFRHRSSRAGDPALHTHVLVANLTRASSDGRWLSLASPRRRSPLFHQAKPAGYVYQAALRANVTRELGLEWNQPHNGYADLELIGRPVIEHFSRRRAEIVEALAAAGEESAKAAEVAAYRTRDAKDYEVEPDAQREEWRARAAEFELSEEAIEASLAAAQAREPREIAAADIAAALGDLESHRSHFDRRELLCALAGRLAEGADAVRLGEATDGLIASGRVVEIYSPASPLEPAFFTTPRLLALEREFIEAVKRGVGATTPLDPESVSAVLARHPHLGADQVEMVRRLTAGSERIAAVSARPGTGKTTALASAREAWAISGVSVIGVAAARSASGELADAGIPSASITALLVRAEEWEARGAEPLAPGTVIVCDEASTASTPQLAALANLAEGCEGKLILVGDPRQIGAVGPGGLYSHLTRIAPPAELSEIRRQRASSDREVVALAHRGQGSDAIDLLRRGERLSITDTLPQALDALVLDWHRARSVGEDAVMIARRTRDVAELNARASALLAAERAKGAPTLRVGQKEIAAGETVITRLNTSKVSNRERWLVEAVDPGAGEIGLRRVGGDGRRVILERAYLDRRTSHGEAAVQHAYAITAYAAEAKTFDSAYVLLDPGSCSEEFLVGVSRARGATHAYGVASLELTDPDLGPGTRPIEDEAHELRAAAERRAPDFAAIETEIRERVWSLGAEELARRRASHPGASARIERGDNRRGSLERSIAEFEARLVDLEASAQTLQSARRPERTLQARLDAQRRMTAEHLKGLHEERKQLPPPTATGASSHEGLEHALVEERIAQLTRRAVAAERLDPSGIVIRTLGGRPGDPAKVALWNQGVHAIHSYRCAHSVGPDEVRALGSQPADPLANREWRAASREIERVRGGLGLERDSGIQQTLV